MNYGFRCILGGSRTQSLNLGSMGFGQRSISNLAVSSKASVHSLTSLSTMSRTKRFAPTPLVSPPSSWMIQPNLDTAPQPTPNTVTPQLLHQQSLFDLNRGSVGNDLVSVICSLRGYSTESSETTSDGESEEEMVEVNIPFRKEQAARLNPDVIDEDWIERNEPNLFENEQTGVWIQRRIKWVDEQDAKEAAAAAAEAGEEVPEPEDDPAAAASAEPEEEPEPIDQVEIERFLKRFGEEDHADKFPNWNALMTFKTRKLRNLEIPMKSRRHIRKQVELFKQALVLYGYSPSYPPWERVTLEEARNRAYEAEVARTMARVESRRDTRLETSRALEAEVEARNTPTEYQDPEEVARQLREIARNDPKNLMPVVSEAEFAREDRIDVEEPTQMDWEV